MEWGRQVMHDILGRGRELGVVRTDWSLEFLTQLTMAMDAVFDHWLLENWDQWNQEELEEFVSKQVAMMKRVLRP